MSSSKYHFIVVGGGVAGTTCAQQLCTIAEDLKVLIISATPLVKSVTNIQAVTKFLKNFDVEEKNPESITKKYPNLKILQEYVTDLDTENHKLTCSDGSSYEYEKLCVCTGSSPKLISTNNEYVLGIRDTETVCQFQARLAGARQIMIIGNGGIATELAYEIENCKVVWAVKDDSISHVYFDAHAAKFFEERLNIDKKVKDQSELRTRKRYTITKVDMALPENQKKVYGSALGSDWSLNLPMIGNCQESHRITIEYKCEVKRILRRIEYEKEQNADLQDWPVFVELTNGKIYGCDFIISATGVTPVVSAFTKNNSFEVASDGGLIVNDQMQTNLTDVFAAGDSCSVGWDLAPHWFQMRLWTQALQMGAYAATSMMTSLQGGKTDLDFCFEMFAHITKFFGFKVILLGNYDARGLDNNYQLLLRSTPGVEYIKIVIYEGRVHGALLIGETELEETFENLILNQIDVSAYGEDLINPDIDIEDYFD